MFKRLTTENLPDTNIKFLLVGQHQNCYNRYTVCEEVQYTGNIVNNNVQYFQFVQNDYGVWDMTEELINKSKLYWIYVEQLIQIIIDSDI